MKNITVLLSILVWFVVQFSSCTTMEYDAGYKKSIVINAHLSTAQNAEVYLSESSNAGLKNKFSAVENAEVFLFENDKQVALMAYEGFGRYEADYKPLPNKKYKIKAVALGYPEAEGEVIMPSEIAFYDFSYSITDSIHEFYDSVYAHKIVRDSILEIKISFKIKDFNETGNYYRLSMFQKKYYESQLGTIPYKVSNGLFGRTTPDFNYTYFKGKASIYIYDDELNNGKEITFNCKVIIVQNEYGSKIDFPLKYNICFEHVSESLVNYYTQLNEYNRASSKIDVDNTMSVDIMKTDFVPNYVPYIMNNPIKGGYGFISAGSGMVDLVECLESPW